MKLMQNIVLLFYAVQIKKSDTVEVTVEKEDEESSDSDSEGPNSVELYKQVLPYLLPGESILKAIKRLGMFQCRSKKPDALIVSLTKMLFIYRWR